MSTPVAGPLAGIPAYIVPTSSDMLAYWDDTGATWRQVTVPAGGGPITGVTAGTGLTGGGTSGTVTLNLSAPVTIANGGTGVTTMTANVLPKGNGSSPLAASTITDAGAGVTIGSPAGGAAGAGSLALPGMVRINANAAALPAPIAGNTLLQAGAADGGTAGKMLLDGFNNAGQVLQFRTSGGSNATPAATGSGQFIGTISAYGRGATGYAANASAQIWFGSVEAFTDTAIGGSVTFGTTIAGTSGPIQARAVIIQGTQIMGGGGAAPTGGDKGLGSLNAGALYVNGAAVSVSDARLKEHIAPSTTDALAALCAIPLYDFDWKSTGPDDKNPRHHSVGFIAQEIDNDEFIVPGPTEADPTSIDTLHVLAHLVKAVQQLSERIERLEHAGRE